MIRIWARTVVDGKITSVSGIWYQTCQSLNVQTNVIEMSFEYDIEEFELSDFGTLAE